MRKINIIHLIIISLLGILLYSNSFNVPFHLDDRWFIVNNENIRDITNLKALWNSPPYFSRIVGIFSFALNYHFNKLNVLGYHLVNLLIHLISGFIVYFFSCLILEFKKEEMLRPFKIDIQNIALFAALIFIAHPVQTQAVTYISQRFESLATMFYLLSCFLFFKARIGRCKNVSICFLFSFVSGLFGMFTKEIVITLPIMILMIEMLFFYKFVPGTKLIRNWFLVLILFAAVFIIPILFKLDIKGVVLTPKVSESHYGDILTLKSYLLTQVNVLARFLRLLILPINQNLDYDFPATFTLFNLKTLKHLTIIIVLFVLGVGEGLKPSHTGNFIKKNKIIAFGLLWIFIAFSANLIPRRYVIFEHKLYLISFGFCLLTSFCIANVVRNKKTYIQLMTVLVIILCLLTFNRNMIWNSKVKLQEDIYKKSPNLPRAAINLAYAYSEDKRIDESIELLNKVQIQTKDDPDYQKLIFNNLANLYVRKNDFDKAIYYYQQILDGTKTDSTIYNSLGSVYKFKGDLKGALEFYNKSIELNRNNVNAYINRANFYFGFGKYDLAKKDYDIAIKINPKDPISFYLRAMLNKRLNNFDDAISDLTTAVKLDPFNVDFLNDRAIVHEKNNSFELALEDYNKALKIDPKDEVVIHNKNLLLKSHIVQPGR